MGRGAHHPNAVSRLRSGLHYDRHIHAPIGPVLAVRHPVLLPLRVPAVRRALPGTQAA